MMGLHVGTFYYGGIRTAKMRLNKQNCVMIFSMVMGLQLLCAFMTGCSNKKTTIEKDPKPGIELSNGSAFTPNSDPVQSFTIGYSVLRKKLGIVRVGDGNEKALVIVGGVHGEEGNTVELVWKLQSKFSETPGLVPGSYTLFFLNALNPDGYSSKTRLNARNVDLNRNFPAKDWTKDAFDMKKVVPGLGGQSAGSEPEVFALKSFFVDFLLPTFKEIRVLVFHSASPPVGYIQPGYLKNGEPEARSANLAERLAKSGGYNFLRAWVDKLPITGELICFCAEQGILAMDIELPTYDSPDIIPKGKTETTFASCERLVMKSFEIEIDRSK
jgi:predicted deacylase